MIITIALGVVLGFFIINVVVRALSNPRFIEGCKMALAAIFLIVGALIVLPRLNREGWIAIGVFLGIIVLLAFVGAFVEKAQHNRRAREALKIQWRTVKRIDRTFQAADHRWYTPVMLSCGHTSYAWGGMPERGQSARCDLCVPAPPIEQSARQVIKQQLKLEGSK